MFIICACVWLLLLWSSGHVRLYALWKSQPCLPISAGLKAASIMHEDQYAVALWARPHNSVSISSIPANWLAVWRDLCLWIYQGSGESRLQSGYPNCYCLGGGEKKEKKTKLVELCLGYFWHLQFYDRIWWQLSERELICAKRAVFSKIYLQLIPH